jgi:multidrug efflux pump subunit AcrA (membrane-fusion protein)
MRSWRFSPVGRPAAAVLVAGLVAAACGSDGLLPTTTVTTLPSTSTTTVTAATTSTVPTDSTTSVPGDHPYGGEVVIGDLEPR